MLRNVIITSSILVLFVVAIVILVMWNIDEMNASSWQPNVWLIDSSITSANILSFCSSNNVHCISDAILACEENNYNSQASVVYLSTDGGETFTLEVFPIYNLQVYAVSNDGNTLVGISQDLSSNVTGLWMSSDGNTTWQPVLQGVATTPITTPIVTPRTTPIVTPITTPMVTPQAKMNMPYGIAMDKSATYLCVCGNNNDGIWYSDDGGETWNVSNAPNGYWLCITMSSNVDSRGIPVVTSAMFSGNSTGLSPDIYYSQNGGKNWTSSATLSLLLQDTRNANENVSLTNNIWGNNNASPKMGFAYQSMSSDGKYQSVIVNTTVYISSDYGSSWESSETDEEVVDWCSISVSADGKTQLLCSNKNGVYQSTDYGNTWEIDQPLLDSDESNLQNIDGTSTYWINASLFEGGVNACTYNFFYYKYIDTKSTMYSIAIVMFSLLFIIVLYCAMYYNWFLSSE
jgi:hypothetical protein